jgi:hypothetical protein
MKDFRAKGGAFSSPGIRSDHDVFNNSFICGKIFAFLAVLRNRIRHTGSGIRSLFDPRSGIRHPGWVKNPDPEPVSGMSIPDHISESLETIFWVKILKFFNADLDPESF